MALLTDEQLHAIREIIRKHHQSFVVNTIGPSAVPPEVLEELKTAGLVGTEVASIEDSYLYGQAMAAGTNPAVATMSLDEFKSWLTKNPIPLSPVERRAVEFAQHRAGQYAVGLGNRIDTSVGETIIQADRALAARFRDEIKSSTAQNIARRESVKSLVSDLKWATKDWSRDWDRIAITEKHNAMQQGMADQYAKEHGPDVLVAKRPMPDACQHCNRLHLGPDGQPRVFKLSELEANGSNFGRKVADWLPTVGAVHPHCFVAGTMVQTEHGPQPIEKILPGTRVLSGDARLYPVSHVWASVYEGDVVTVRTALGELTATADHPFYGADGWRPAHRLNEGENLFGFEGDVDRSLLPDLDSVARPSIPIEDRHFASILFGFSRAGVPVTAIHFHGEFYLREGEVDQTTIEQITGGRVQAQTTERIIDPAFVGRFEFAHMPPEDGKDHMFGLRPSSDSGVESGDVGAPLFWGQLAHSDLLSFRPGASGSTGATNAVSDSPAADFQALGYLLHREQLVEVQVEDLDHIEFSPKRHSFSSGPLPEGFLSNLSPTSTPIVSVKTSQYRGMVYNLTVETMHTYVANGHHVHNCQCQLIRIPEGWGFDEDGSLVPGGSGEPKELRKAISHATFQGIPIAIETKKGQKRKWTDAQGKTGETLMLADYGFIKKTGGADAEEIDVYLLGSNPRSTQVFIVHQIDPSTGIYDEDKCFLGAANAAEARIAFQAHRNDAGAYGGMTAMDIDHFKRWVAGTAPMKGHSVPQTTIPLGKALNRESRVNLEKVETRFVLDAESLEKAEARGGKYFRRVPYTDAKGKRRYRYYYTEAAAARGAVRGEEIKLGKQTAKVISVHKDGAVTIELDGKQRKVKPDQWHNLLTRHYGQAYTKSADRRAQQAINAVLRHVPRELLEDLKGATDAERLRDLKKRGPKVYAKLKAAFSRAGVTPFQAKRTIDRTLERRGWEPEARALVIGSVMRHRTLGARDLIRASESVAGGRKVESRHVAAVVELRAPGGKPEAFPQMVKSTAESAEKELADLAAVLAKVKAGKVDGSEALVQALGSNAIQKLNLLTAAFPGLQDKVAQKAREAMPAVVSVTPRKGPTTDGAETNVYVAGEGGAPVALTARYRLMEAGDIIASHKPESFAKHPDYPAGVQERAYHRDKAEQAKVIRNAQRMNPQFVINTNPDAVNGPPLITADGVVLGGNSRVMSMQRVYSQHPEKAAELRKYLTSHAHEGGFTAADVEAMKQPVLVREVVVEDKSKQSLQLLVRQMNETFTQGMDPRTMQVAMGRKLTDETLATLAGDMGEDQTLSDFLGSSKADRFVSALFRAGIIDARNSNQYMARGTKTLNNDGKTLVSRILVGRTVNDADILSSTGTQMMDSIARAVPFMHQATAHGKGYAIGADLAVAIDGFNHLQARVESGSLKNLDPKMSEKDFGRLFNQMSLLGSDHPVEDNPKAMQLLEVLVRKRGPIQMANIFRDYARRAAQNPEGQATMFGKVEPADIFRQTMDAALGRGEEKLAASMTKAVTRRTTSPLPSSGRVSTEIGAQTSSAAFNNPGHGTFPNFMVKDGMVARHPVKMHPALEGWDPGETSPGDVEKRRIHVDADDYQMTLFEARQARQEARPVEIQDQLYFRGDDDRQRSKDLREWLEDQDEENRQRPRNNVEVEKDT